MLTSRTSPHEGRMFSVRCRGNTAITSGRTKHRYILRHLDIREHISGVQGISPPTKEEYKSLMEPVAIDKMEWEEPEHAGGETIGNITITYTINDVRIFKSFADAGTEHAPRPSAASRPR